MAQGLQFIRLYPDVARLALLGMLFLFFSVFAGWADRRRSRREQLDSVGFMPWPTLSILALFTALVFLAFAVHDWMTG
jgi:hypothetical protein